MSLDIHSMRSGSPPEPIAALPDLLPRPVRSVPLLALALAGLGLSCSGGGTSPPGGSDYVPEVFVPAANLPALHVDGNRIANGDGTTVVLKGIALADPHQLDLDGHWDEEHFQQAKSWGAQAVRIPVHPKYWRTRGPAGYLALLDQGVTWAEERGMYVMIDWHGMGDPNAEVYETGQDAIYVTSQAETRSFWRILATHYKDDPGVAFYEIFNENTNWMSDGTTTRTTWAQWKPLAESFIDIVRAQGSKAICIVSGFKWAYDLSPVGAAPVARDGVAYAVHPYSSKGTPATWQADFGYLAGTHPVLSTEFGFVPNPADPVAYGSVGSYGEPITEFFAARGIGWTVWVFHPIWTPNLISDWSYTPAEPQGSFFRSVLQEK